MKKCINCGFIVYDDNANFCPECGNNLVSLNEPESSSDSLQSADSTVVEITGDDAPAAPAMNTASDPANTPVYTWFPPEESEKTEILPDTAASAPATDVFSSAGTYSAQDTPTVPLDYASADSPTIPLAYTETNTPAAPETPPVHENLAASLASAAYAASAVTSGASSFGSGSSDQFSQQSQVSAPAVPEVPTTAQNMSMPEPPAAPVPPVENNTTYTGPVPVTPAQGGSGPRGLSESTIVEILDRNIDMTGKVLGSPWFILAIAGFILFTCSYIVNAVFSYITPVKIDLTWLGEIYTNLGIDFDEIVETAYDNRLGTLIGSIVTVIPMILSGIGGIMMIANSKKRPIPSSGTTLAKTNLVFKLVIVIICAIGSICVMIASFLIGEEYFAEYFGKNEATAFRLLMFFIALVLIFVFLCFIFYYIGMIKTLTVAKKAGLEGKCPKNRVSVYAAVINIIAAVFMLIGFIMSVIDIKNANDIIDAVFSCSGVIYYFCVGMSMFRLKDLLTELPGIK